MTMTTNVEKSVYDAVIVMNTEHDQTAIAKVDIEAGEAITDNGIVIEIRNSVKKGERFAIREIPQGEYVRQNGYAFGRSKGIEKGEIISSLNIINMIPDTDLEEYSEPADTEYNEELCRKTFSGYPRKDGTAGTRNYYLVIPTSMCASEVALQVASSFADNENLLEKYSSLDGIIAIPHTEGCGCDSEISISRLMRVLAGYARHPNVGGCLIIDLGCEQTNYRVMHSYMEQEIPKNLKPIDWITIEENGGVEASIKKAREIIIGQLRELNENRRQDCPIEKLVVGTECGASDSFSGLTANPLIGNVADRIVLGKGMVILSEIPELVGTEQMLHSRFSNLNVSKKFRNLIKWYEDLAGKLGMTLESNLVPKNVEGGLFNTYIKSLGAVLKGGTTVIEDVVDYGEPLVKSGLNIMQGPGGDLESVTGMVASGANMVLFSTGQGTPTGNAICPVIKVASNSDVFLKLSNDLDFNGGRLFDEYETIESLGDELLNMVIEVASGKQTAAEKLKQRQFQIWTAGKLPL